MSKILVVEDNKNQRTLYVQELQDQGYDVDSASNGHEAVKKVINARPDLVILDIRMDGMDGIETLSKILEHDKTISVIINTAYSNYKDHFMTWSADAYLVKSGDLTELKKKIKELLEISSAIVRSVS